VPPPPSVLPKAISKRLVALLRMSDTIVATGVFVHLVRYRLEVHQYFADPSAVLSVSAWLRLVREKGDVALLSAIVVYLLVMFRYGARRSLSHAFGLFSQSRIPHEWTGLYGYQSVVWMVGAFYALILVLVLSVERISVFCLTLAALFINSLRSHLLRRNNLRRYFADARYTPGDNDDHKPFIMRRRVVAERDLFGNKRVIKESLVIASCLCTSAVAFIVEFTDARFLNWVPYFLIAWTLVLNEAITSEWRIARDRDLEKIDADQEADDRRRTEEDRRGI
jgi:hypothetical protein